MRVHFFTHVPYEGGAFIENWARARGFDVSHTKFHESSLLPSLDDIDWLVVMGGPMNADENETHPFLKKEKVFIEKAIISGKKVLGICLGAQLIARMLCAKVFRNPYKEIGWYPVYTTEESRNSYFFSGMPKSFTAFHWHGDTFEIPPGAIRLAYSDACDNQAFEYGSNVLALQFHLEATPESVMQLADNAESDITDAKYVQKKEKILSVNEYVSSNKLMEQILHKLHGSKK